MCEAEGVKRGTKVVIHLKGDAHEFAKEEKIKGESCRITDFNLVLHRYFHF